MKEKHDKNVDRAVRFRTVFEDPIIVVPPDQSQQLTDLVLMPIVFAWPDGAKAENT